MKFGPVRGRRLFLLGLLLLLLPTAAFAADKKSGGIGLAVVPTAAGELVVLDVVDNSPAADEGMRPGDLIVEVDDFSLRGSDFAEVTSRYLWGEAGTPVTLKFLRPGKEGLQAVTLKRIPLDVQGRGAGGRQGLPARP